MKSKNATVWHKIFLILADVLSVVVAILFAYLITVEDRGFSAGLLGWTLGNIVCTIALFGFFGMYAVVFSSVGIIDALKLSLAVVCTTALNLIFAVLTQKAYINIGTALVYGALLFYVTVMVRFSKRIVVVMKYYLSGGHSQKKRVMIV